MNKKAQKIAALSLSALMGTGVLVTTVDAASLTRNLRASYNNIKVTYDGDFVGTSKEPFMVDGTVYVSLRDAGQITGNGVTWASNTVNITSGGASNGQVILQKDMQIAMLSNKVKDLQEQLDKEHSTSSNSTSSSSTSKASMKTVLSDIRDKYEGSSKNTLKINWDIDLEEKSGDAFLTLTYTGKSDQSRYKDASASKVESFLRDICEDISDKLDIQVNGEIIDNVTSKVRVGEFSYNSSRSLRYTKLKVASSTESFADKLYEDYKNKLPRLINQGDLLYTKDIKIDKLKIKDTGSNEYEFSIEVDLYGEEKRDWDVQGVRNRQANTREIRDFMRKIRDEIASEFGADKDDVEGYIYNGSRMMVQLHHDEIETREID